MFVMGGLADWWGLSLPQTLIVIAAILVILDILFQSDVATLIAYTLVSVAVAIWVPVHPLFRVLIGMVAWGGLVYVHYTLWREFATLLVNRVIAPTRYRSGAKGLIGTTATVKEVGGQKMVSAQGDLWSFTCSEDPSPDAKVRILAERGGVLDIEIVREEG
jgi:membrane protein implicated in regulation of membrane protease activity